jgi:hypothetical protein
MTPWWARKSKLAYTHMVVQVNDFIWDQPIRGKGSLYRAKDWLREALSFRRRWCNMEIEAIEEDNDFSWVGMVKASDTMSRAKGQPIRTVLRYMGLWPKRAWNCTGPAILMLRNMGMEVKGETPDDILKEILSAAEGSSSMANCEQDPPDRAERLD